jgi:nucleotide-binding universal stress UspA family protein
MYRRILVPLEHSDTDRTILAHVRELARVCNSSLVLIHVADGWAARNASRFALRESEEMRTDRAYLEALAEQLESEGFAAEAVLAGGDPAAEIAAAATRERCDLIAMSTHGHKLLTDLVLGSVANEVRHQSLVPVLLVRKAAAPPATGRDDASRSAQRHRE